MIKKLISICLLSIISVTFMFAEIVQMKAEEYDDFKWPVYQLYLPNSETCYDVHQFDEIFTWYLNNYGRPKYDIELSAWVYDDLREIYAKYEHAYEIIWQEYAPIAISHYLDDEFILAYVVDDHFKVCYWELHSN